MKLAQRKPVRAFAFVASILALCWPLCTPAQELKVKQDADLVGYFQPRQLELRVVDGRLTGPAAQWLRKEAAHAQFLFVGEEHDTREIPLICSALWREIVPLGYLHVALEAGPWLGNRLDRFARFNDERALAQFKAAALPRRPGLYVPPASQEDIEFFRMLRETPPVRSPLVWGLDLESKVTPLLERLLTLNRGDGQRRLAQPLLQKVSAAEKAGDYDLSPFRSEIDQLTGQGTGRTASETAHILDALRRRARGKLSDEEREEMMKQLFLRNYRAAQSAGEKRPRVLLRFGSDHGRRGVLLDYGTSTLANFIAEFAAAEGTRMLTVIFIGCSLDLPDGAHAEDAWPCSSRERVWLKPFSGAAAHPWTLFDLRDLRRQLQSLSLSYELREIIAGYDAVVVLKNSKPARFAN